jgi:hypothetical protein
MLISWFNDMNFLLCMSLGLRVRIFSFYCTKKELKGRDGERNTCFNEAFSCYDYVASMVGGWKWECSIGGTILTAENRSIRRKPYPSVTLSTTYSTWTCLESNSVSIGKRYRTGTAVYGDVWRLVLSGASGKGTQCWGFNTKLPI